MDLNRLISVDFGTPQVVDKVQNLKDSDEPIKVLQFSLIEVVIRKPIGAIRALSELVNQGNHKTTHIVSHRYGHPK